jgi:hypothetical protein
MEKRKIEKWNQSVSYAFISRMRQWRRWRDATSVHLCHGEETWEMRGCVHIYERN